MIDHEVTQLIVSIHNKGGENREEYFYMKPEE